MTFQHQVMPLDGRVHDIDWCVRQTVAALAAAMIGTTGSCCGHQRMLGKISLADGRVIAIFPDEEVAQPVWQAREQK